MTTLSTDRLLVCLAVISGCQSADEPFLGSASLLSWNVANLSYGPSADIEALVTSDDYDFLLFQECPDCADFKIPSMDWIPSPGAGLMVAFNSARWGVASQGWLLLGDNTDGWGKRYAQWAEFTAPTGHLVVYNTHFCVPIRSTSDECDDETQADFVATILNHTTRFDDQPIIIAGDFNVFGAFEESAAIKALTQAEFTDILRQEHPTAPLTTFVGNDWAPSGRLDYIFALMPKEIVTADVVNSQLSDHLPIFAEVVF